MCITRALHHGPRAAMTGVAGPVMAVLCVMLLSAMGLGALLALGFMVPEVGVLTACALGGPDRAWPLRSGPARWLNRVRGGLFAQMAGPLLTARR